MAMFTPTNMVNMFFVASGIITGGRFCDALFNYRVYQRSYKYLLTLMRASFQNKFVLYLL